MHFLGPVLELFVAGNFAQATQLVATGTVTTAVVGELEQAAAFVEDHELSSRLRGISDQLNTALQVGDEAALKLLRTGLSQLFKEMDADARRQLAERLRGFAAKGENVAQTLLEMMRKGRWRELGTFLSQQPSEALQEPAVLRSRFALKMEQGDSASALRITEEMWANDPVDPEVYLSRAEWALRWGDLRDAQKLANEAQRTAARRLPADKELYDRFCSVWVRIHLADKNWRRAEEQLLEWFDHGSDSALAERYYLRGRIRRESSRLDPHSATIWMEKAVELYPLRTDYLLGLAWAYFGEKKIPAARQVLQKLERLQPMNPHLWEEVADLRLEIGDTRSVLLAYQRSATLLKPRLEALIPAGLGIVLAYGYEDLEEGTAFEIFLREVVRYHNPQIQEGSVIFRWAIQNYYRAVEERQRAGREKFQEIPLRFGATLFAAAAFLDPILGEESQPFIDLGWKLGAKLFGEEVFDAVMEFLWDVKGLPSQAASYVHGGERPERWSEPEEANILAAIQLAFGEKRYLAGVQLVHDTLARFGISEKMKASSRAQLERWLRRLIFYWAFDGISVKPEELEEYVSVYRHWTSDAERLNYVRILVRRYDGMGLPQVGDRLLILNENSTWMHLLVHRYLDRHRQGEAFDDFILGLVSFRAALARVQGKPGPGGAN